MIWKYLVNRGFTPHYYIWFHLVKGDSRNEASSNTHFETGGNWEEPSHLHPESSYPQEDHVANHDRMHDIVINAFRETTSVVVVEVENVEELNLYAKRFYKC